MNAEVRSTNLGRLAVHYTASGDFFQSLASRLVRNAKHVTSSPAWHLRGVHPEFMNLSALTCEPLLWPLFDYGGCVLEALNWYIGGLGKLFCCEGVYVHVHTCELLHVMEAGYVYALM